jgi:hypothetical protein
MHGKILRFAQDDILHILDNTNDKRKSGAFVAAASCGQPLVIVT